MNTNWLFPAQEERLEIDDLLTRRLADAHARAVVGPVAPIGFDADNFRNQLAAFDFVHPCRLGETLAWTIEQMERGIVQVTHPRYFGLFNPDPTFPAQCADRIGAVFNPQLATATTSPAAVEIEAHVISAVAGRVGLPPESRGHFTTGGSEANCTAVILALTRLCPGFAEEGVLAFPGPPVFYVSAESHLAWIKIARQTGLGRSAVRLVATDGTGRLDPAALTKMIKLDLSHGCVPFMVAATAGTTNAGRIDPLVDCAEIARSFQLWYHVDAAWGGGLIASDKLKPRLSGIELADSVTIDAHKWFATTMGCGMFMTRLPALLSAAFHVAASFMPSNTAAVDPYVTSMQWSRRFLGLRLFLSLTTVGWSGYGEHMERTVAMAQLLKQQLIAVGWNALHEPLVGVLCIIPPKPRAIQSIVRHVLASGRAWISVATTEGREVIRICITSGMTTTEDISDLVAALLQAADKMHLQQEQTHG